MKFTKNFTNFFNYKKFTCIGFGLGIYYTYNNFENKKLKLIENERLVYSWGNGISGQLGIGEEISSLPIPKEIKQFTINKTKIEKLVAAFDISCGITKNGEVYVWGKTKDGALGVIPGGSGNLVTPSLFVHLTEINNLENNIKPIDIDFSKEHGVLVTSNGSLYTWGIDMFHKLGHTTHNLQTNQKLRRMPKHSSELIKFAKIDFNEKIVSAKCGYNHTICLTETNEVYSWGYGKDGALGHQDFNNVETPKKIEYFSKNNLQIKKIESGDYFCMALTDDGKIYTWGHNNYGQLGLGRITQMLKVNSPLKIDLGDKRVKEIFAGEDHCACVTEDGEGYIWGYGIDGRLGNKNKMNQNTPTKISIDNSKIRKISCGGHHTAILTEEGDLYMCGNGRDGELGRGDLLESQSVVRYEPLLVTQFKHNNEKVIDVACGSSHTIAIIEK